MKTLQLLLSTSLIFLGCSLSFGQGWLWGAAGYGSLKKIDYGTPVATDKNGNAYVTGNYYSEAIFGQDTLIGNVENAYLVKYNSAGTVLWTKQPTGAGSYSIGASVTTDIKGNIYLCGQFEGILNFGTYTLNSNGEYAVYLAKYSPSGNVLWAKQSGTANIGTYGYGTSVTTDNSGNAFITGYFDDTISFGTKTLIPASTYAITTFLAKYDSNGNTLWVVESDMPSTSCAAYGNAVTTDKSGNVYVAGHFEIAVYFGSTLLISPDNYSAFLAKYSAGGTLLWAIQTTDLNPIVGIGYAYSAVTDRKNNCYITGYFEDSVQFGGYKLYSPSAYSTFLTKYDSNGHAVWARQSSAGWEGTGLSSDKFDYIYMGGENTIVDSKISFGSFTLNAIPWANSNAFLIKFDTTGTPVCGSVLENLGSNYAPYQTVGVASDSSGNFVYTAGSFEQDTIKCGGDTLVSSGAGDTFLGRWQNCGVETSIPPAKADANLIHVYPNPFSNSTTISILHSPSTIHNLELDDITGRKLKSIEFTGNTYTLSAEGLAKGMYFVRVFDKYNNVIGTTKIVVQ